MPDLTRLGAKWLDDQMRLHGRTQVAYQRGATIAPELPATIGRPQGEMVDAGGGGQMQARWQSFVLTVDDLRTANLWPPQLDDEIVVPETAETVKGTGGRFRVQSPFGQPPWHYSDEHGVAVRIQTVRSRDS